MYSEAKEMFATVSINLQKWKSNSEELMYFITVSDHADHSILSLKNDNLYWMYLMTRLRVLIQNEKQ